MTSQHGSGDSKGDRLAEEMSASPVCCFPEMPIPTGVKITISTPETVKPTGNFGTAFQWADIIGNQLGHEVKVTDDIVDPDTDVLVAVHASKSAPGVRKFRESHPKGKLIVAAAGTDVYPEPDQAALESFRLADRIVLLQERAALQLPPEDRHKAVTILQSAVTGCFQPPEDRSRDPFDVCVIGFLRDIKDPMRAAMASRRLPGTSKIRIRHAGGILEEKYRQKVEHEMASNSRYHWMGIITREEIDVLLSECQLMVLSSFHEGGARVVSYALVNHTPVLAAASDCAISLLGESYPGLYPPGDTEALTNLLNRAETDFAFLETLRKITKQLAPKFSPDLEVEGWRNIL